MPGVMGRIVRERMMLGEESDWVNGVLSPMLKVNCVPKTY